MRQRLVKEELVARFNLNAGIAGQSYNLREGGTRIRLQELADRLLVGPQPSRRGFIHHDDRRGGARLLLGKPATANNWNSHGGEVVRSDSIAKSEQWHISRLSYSIWQGDPVSPYPAEWNVFRPCNRLSAGQGPQARSQFPMKRSGAGLVIIGQFHARIHDERFFGIEPRVDLSGSNKTAQQYSRRDQQR